MYPVYPEKRFQAVASPAYISVKTPMLTSQSGVTRNGKAAPAPKTIPARARPIGLIGLTACARGCRTAPGAARAGSRRARRSRRRTTRPAEARLREQEVEQDEDRDRERECVSADDGDVVAEDRPGRVRVARVRRTVGGLEDRTERSLDPERERPRDQERELFGLLASQRADEHHLHRHAEREHERRNDQHRQERV